MTFSLTTIPGNPVVAVIDNASDYTAASATITTETLARFAIYKYGVAYTMLANDQFILYGYSIHSASAASFQVFDGADFTIDAGEQKIYARTTTTFVNPNMYGLYVPFALGTYPKLRTSAAITQAVVLYGSIHNNALGVA